MPWAPPRACRTCGRIHCPVHQALAPWTPGAHVTPRLRGRALQVQRAQLFRREPWCRLCAREGRRTRATIRDHVVPLAAGGREEACNVQPLCQACSDRKTRGEAVAGRREDVVRPSYLRPNRA
jgi:5-methylcytosine-specific restriction protein A